MDVHAKLLLTIGQSLGPRFGIILLSGYRLNGLKIACFHSVGLLRVWYTDWIPLLMASGTSGSKRLLLLIVNYRIQGSQGLYPRRGCER